MILSFIPRFYWFKKLCSFVCCGGKRKDTHDDRQALLTGVHALLVSQFFTIITTLIITIAFGKVVNELDLLNNGNSDINNMTELKAAMVKQKVEGLGFNPWSRVSHVLANQIIGFAFALWWRFDIKKWVASKPASA